MVNEDLVPFVNCIFLLLSNGIFFAQQKKVMENIIEYKEEPRLINKRERKFKFLIYRMVK